MKILAVHPFYPSGVYTVKRAPSRHEQDRHVVERGHSVCVISCKTFGAPSFERIGNVEIYRVPSLTLPIIEYPFPNLLMLFFWVKALSRQKDVDIIHVTDSHYLTTLVVPFLKWSLKKPLVLTIIGFPGVSWFYGNFLVDFSGKIYMLTIGRRILKYADKLVLSAKCLTKDAVRFGVPLNKIEVLHRGVNLEVFRPDRMHGESLRRGLGIKKDDIVVLFAGRLVPVKGLKYFIEAAKILVRKNRKLKFIVAGDGVLRSKYEKEVRSCGSSIKFIGYRHDMSDVMNAADIFVLSSLSEGCPNAVLEAGACGKPVIATDVGAARDLILNGGTGLVIEPRKVDELCAALEKLVANYDLEDMGQKALQHVRKNFSWDKIVAQHERIYFEALRLSSAK